MAIQHKIYGGAIAAVGLLTVVMSRSFPDLPEGYPGPGLFPLIIGGLLIIAGLVIVFSKMPQDERIKDAFKGQWGKIFILLAAILLFPLLHRYAGFIPTMIIIGFVVATLLRLTFIKAALVAGGSALVVYLLFSQLLHVPL